MKAALFWSGGKDSAYALYLMLNNYPEIEVALLITTLNQEYKRISMHGIREELLDRQAAAIGIPLLKMWVPNIPTNENYEKCLGGTLKFLKEEGFEYVVFGDIFLEDLKQYREQFLERFHLKGVFPLWQKDTRKQIEDFISAGFETFVCCTNSKYLGEDRLGIKLDAEFLSNLPKDVDPCGENGEFHTFCFNGPIFKHPVPYSFGEKEYKPIQIKTTEGEAEFGFWYIDVL